MFPRVDRPRGPLPISQPPSIVFATVRAFPSVPTPVRRLLRLSAPLLSTIPVGHLRPHPQHHRSRLPPPRQSFPRHLTPSASARRLPRQRPTISGARIHIPGMPVLLFRFISPVVSPRLPLPEGPSRPPFPLTPRSTAVSNVSTTSGRLPSSDRRSPPDSLLTGSSGRSSYGRKLAKEDEDGLLDLFGFYGNDNGGQ